MPIAIKDRNPIIDHAPYTSKQAVDNQSQKNIFSFSFFVSFNRKLKDMY